jgi:transcriptional regulator with XRE-family HTH domain
MKAPPFDQRGFQREIGLRLALVRKIKGVTQEKLSARIGIGRAQLANVEAGRSRVYVDQVWRAAIVLGVPISKLIPERQ